MRAVLLFIAFVFYYELQAQRIFIPDTNGIIHDTAFVALLKARKYDIVHRFQHQANHQYLKVALVERNGKKGFIDQTGLEFIPCEYTRFDYNGYGLRNGRWERVDLYHRFISPAHYKSITPFGKHYYIVTNKRNAYLIDYTNTKVKGMSFSKIDYYSYQLQEIRVKKGRHSCGIINTDAQILIPPVYQGVIKIGHGAYLVTKNGSDGVVDTSGNFIIPLKYDKIVFEHRRSFLIVKNKDRYGMLNQKGDTLVPLIYDMLSPDFYGTITFRLNGNYGLMDTLGKVKINAEFQSLKVYSDGPLVAVAKAQLYYFKLNGKTHQNLRNWQWGLYNIDSAKCMPLIYDQIEDIHQDNFLVRKNNHYGYINSKGRVIADTLYRDMTYLNEMRALLPDTTLSKSKRLPIYISKRHIILDSSKAYGMLRHDGSMVLPYRYSKILMNFGAVLTTDFRGFQGLYDTAGNAVLPQPYKSIEFSFYSDPDSTYILKYQPLKYLIVKDTAGRYGLFSSEGRPLIPCRYKQLQLLDSRYILASEDSLFGILDTNGHVLLPFTYRSISKFGKYFIIQQDLRGLLDQNLKMLLPCIYELVYPVNTPFFRLVKGGASALYNSSNGAMSEFHYKSFAPSFDMIVIGYTNYGPQYLNENCKLLLAPNTTLVNKHSDIFIFKNQSGKYGMCDRYGNILYPAMAEKIQFRKTAYYHRHDCYYFLKEGKWGVLDAKGNQILAPVYDEIRPAYLYKTKMYTFDTWLVRLGNKWYQCDAYGNLNRIRRLVKLKFD